MLRRRFGVAPRMGPLAVLGRTECSAMELLLRREGLVRPARIGLGLCLADIHRPRSRQRNFFKHRPVEPSISTPYPELGMPDSGGLNPLPAFAAPERRVFVSTALHELQKLPVRNVQAVD